MDIARRVGESNGDAEARAAAVLEECARFAPTLDPDAEFIEENIRERLAHDPAFDADQVEAFVVVRRRVIAQAREVSNASEGGSKAIKEAFAAPAARPSDDDEM